MIRITEQNAEKLTAAIDAGQKGARVRTICRADVFDAVEEIDRKLAARLYKKEWLGLVVTVNVHAQTFPNAYNAYNGTPESTSFAVIRRASGWFLDRVGRGVCDNQQYRVNIADKAAALADYASRNF